MDQNVDDLQDRSPAIRQIDSVDRALLEALSHDARMSLRPDGSRVMTDYDQVHQCAFWAGLQH